MSSPSAVSVNYATASNTATSSNDYFGVSGILTFDPSDGISTKSITIMLKDDSIFETDESFFVRLTKSTNARITAWQSTVTVHDNDPPATKFFVVNDGSPDANYEYSASGAAVRNDSLATGNTAPRGIASNAAGTRVWVLDASRKVFVYDTSNVPTGAPLLMGSSWSASNFSGTAQVEGITTNGTDVWIVDAKSDKVYRYAGVANKTSGTQSASSSFSLASGNTNPKDLVTDGNSIWVVNDGTADTVFKYTLTGTLVGSWTINGGGGSPTGITIDPTAPLNASGLNTSNFWIVDSATDRNYQFNGDAVSGTATSRYATMSYALAAGNTNPQGIAHPPPPASPVNSTQTTAIPTVSGMAPPVEGAPANFRASRLAGDDPRSLLTEAETGDVPIKLHAAANLAKDRRAPSHASAHAGIPTVKDSVDKSDILFWENPGDLIDDALLTLLAQG